MYGKVANVMMPSFARLVAAFQKASGALHITHQLISVYGRCMLRDDSTRPRIDSIVGQWPRWTELLTVAADFINTMPRQAEYSEVGRGKNGDGKGEIQTVSKFTIPDASPASIPELYRPRANELLMKLKEMRRELDNANQWIVGNCRYRDGRPMFREAVWLVP
jgi:hypothetical protein